MVDVEGIAVLVYILILPFTILYLVFTSNISLEENQHVIEHMEECTCWYENSSAKFRGDVFSFSMICANNKCYDVIK